MRTLARSAERQRRTLSTLVASAIPAAPAAAAFLINSLPPSQTAPSIFLWNGMGKADDVFVAVVAIHICCCASTAVGGEGCRGHGDSHTGHHLLGDNYYDGR